MPSPSVRLLKRCTPRSSCPGGAALSACQAPAPIAIAALIERNSAATAARTMPPTYTTDSGLKWSAITASWASRASGSSPKHVCPQGECCTRGFLVLTLRH